MNIHPALIPAFCGKGFYGEKVHRAVLDAGVKVSGCTVHFADDQYDHGPIILQGTVPVLDDDTPETLAARVHVVENELYPEAIRLWAEGRLEVAGRRVEDSPARVSVTGLAAGAASFGGSLRTRLGRRPSSSHPAPAPHPSSALPCAGCLQPSPHLSAPHTRS